MLFIYNFFFGIAYTFLKMEKVWNDFDLKKPPFLTLPSKYGQFVLEIHGAIETYFSKLSQYEEEFNEAAALLSRLMARRKNSFNKMKGFKDICKLNAALCRLLRVDFKRDLDSFRSTLPDVEYGEDTIIHLPTRDSYDYLLLRLLAVYELHQRIGYCCLSAAEYFTSQLRQNYFFDINTLLLAVLAKIYNFSIKLANLTVKLYNQTLPHRTKLPKHFKSKFLKYEPHELPTKLEIIELKTVDNQLLDNGSKDLPIVDLIKQEHKLSVKAASFKKTDLGTKVERSSNIIQKSFDIHQLNTVEDIKKFVVVETKSRTKNIDSSITKKILSHEWAGAVKLFERKVQNGEAKKALNIFRKFISSKI